MAQFSFSPSESARRGNESQARGGQKQKFDLGRLIFVRREGRSGKRRRGGRKGWGGKTGQAPEKGDFKLFPFSQYFG